MWNKTRRGNNILRQRRFDRKVEKRSINKIMGFMLVFLLTTFLLGAYIIISRYNNIGEKATSDIKPYFEKLVKIYDEIREEEKELKQEVVNKKDEMSFTVLGEIMMGGNDFASYTLPYKEISEYTKKADYTVAHLTTNITSLQKIENPKTKYIVKKDILNTFSALGVDAVNIANDHALDFGYKIFKNTKSILEKEELDIIGLKSNIVYAEENGIRVAFIGTCNEVIGMQSYYEKAGINMYNLKKIEEDIKIARTKADTVIVMVHLGLENEHKKTSIMQWYYKLLIDYGADAVLGSHALGIHPIEIYKGKPIIYSLGYFMHDTDFEIGKESGIFTFTVDIKGNITKINIIPTYIKDKKETVLYYEYNKTAAIKLLNKIGLNIKTKDKTMKEGQLIISLK